MRILLVEDEAPLRETLAARLKREGFAVDAAQDGEEGLYTESRLGFDVDGVEVKGRLDFAAKAIDWRGMYQDPGA